MSGTGAPSHSTHTPSPRFTRRSVCHAPRDAGSSTCETTSTGVPGRSLWRYSVRSVPPQRHWSREPTRLLHDPERTALRPHLGLEHEVAGPLPAGEPRLGARRSGQRDPVGAGLEPTGSAATHRAAGTGAASAARRGSRGGEREAPAARRGPAPTTRAERGSGTAAAVPRRRRSRRRASSRSARARPHAVSTGLGLGIGGRDRGQHGVPAEPARDDARLLRSVADAFRRPTARCRSSAGAGPSRRRWRRGSPAGAGRGTSPRAISAGGAVDRRPRRCSGDRRRT